MIRVRRLLALVSLGLLGAGAVALVWSGEDGRRPGSGPPQGRPAAAPTGSLRVGVPELADSYNPFDPRARTPAATQVLGAVLPQLFDVDPRGRVRGRLVDEDSVRETDGTVSFRLAEGARWSDGRPVTVEDLRFTLEVIRSGRWPGPKAGYDALARIEGRGQEVVFRFRAPLAGWERLFSEGDYVLPRHRLEGTDLQRVWAEGPDLAAGPYRFEGWTPGLDVVLVANPEWWGEGPGVRAIRLLTVPDATTLEQLFERGELDVAWMPAFTERRRVAREVEGAQVAVAPPGGRLVSLVVNADRVSEEQRVAALALVDRDRFVDVLLHGEAEVATSWGLLRESPGWARWAVDSTRARQVGSETLVLAAADEEPMAGLLVRAVQRRARDSNLSFDAARVLAGLLDGVWLPEGEFDLALVDETQWPQPCWRCRWGSREIGRTNWSRAEGLDGLAEAADRGDAGAAAELERRLRRSGLVLPLWRPAAVVVSRGVDGIEANSWSPGPLYRPERWRSRGN